MRAVKTILNEEFKLPQLCADED